MEDNIFFSCGNIILIPSKILSNYPRFSWMSEYFKKIKQGVVVLISNTTASLETIDIVNIIAYAALEFKKKKIKIITLVTTNTLIQDPEILLQVLTRLVDFIKQTFYRSIVRKVDISDVYQINFYIAQNFTPVPEKNTSTKVYLMYTSDYDQNTTTISNNIVFNTEINAQLIKFPTTLAKKLSLFVQLNYEVGGNICIDSIEHINAEDVLVLGLKPDRVVKGDFANVSFPFEDFTPFSFHTHPDITIVIGNTQRYISWPSGLDIRAILTSFLYKQNLLAHFVVTSEGIWVIYVTVAFQKFLSNLAVLYKNDLSDIINNIGDVYATVEKYRITNFIDPIHRNDIKKDFIEKSNTLTIKDLTSVQEKHYNGDNFLLFKLRLLTWKSLKKDKILKLPYFVAPEAGLSAKLSSTCHI